MSTPKLRVENLRKTFGSETAVDDISLVVEDGELKSLLGPSGCGKTTTLRSIAGLEEPDSGQIYIDGELVFDREENRRVPPENRDIGMVFQSYAVWPHMTVRENVMYPLRANKVGTKEEREEKVNSVLDTVGLLEFGDNISAELSGGQQQRVALARALADEPEILLFDEPLSNLDAKLRREMRAEINRIHDEFDIAVLYVTHSQDEAMFLSDEIVVMNEGRIAERGPPATLHNEPETLFGMEFMGRSNTVHGELRTRDDSGAVFDTPIGTLRSTNPHDGVEPGTDVAACFRPKYANVVEGTPDSADNLFSGPLTLQALTRDFTEYYVDVNGREILLRTFEPLAIEEGDTVQFAVDPDRVRAYPTGETVETDHAADYATTDADEPSNPEAP